MKKSKILVLFVMIMLVITGCGKNSKKTVSSNKTSDSNISSTEIYNQEGEIGDGPSIIDEDTTSNDNTVSNNNSTSSNAATNNSSNKTSNSIDYSSAKNKAIVRIGESTSTVHFNTNGGKAISDVVFCNSCAPIDYELPTPVKEGYVFAGWYADNNFTKEVTGGRNTVRGVNWVNLGNEKYETTIYAKWVKMQSIVDNNCVVRIGSGTATVHFNSNGGSSVADKVFCTACAPIQYDLPVPKRAGYTFDGWYADSNLTNKVTGGKNTINGVNWTAIDCNRKETTIYAKWVK